MKPPMDNGYRPPGFPQPDESMPIVFPLVADLDNPDFVEARRKYQVEFAESLWCVWRERRAARERDLSALAGARNRDNAVLLMTLNRGYAQLLENWVASCERHAIEVRSWTVIVTFDEETARRFEDLGFAVYCDEVSYGTQKLAASAEFGDQDFTRMMFPKTAAVQDLLNLGYDVLFQDVDLVWRKDPGRVLFDPRRRDLDAQFMYDGPNGFYQPLHANTGFFFLRNTPAARRFWELVCRHFDKTFFLQSQQRVVNIVLTSRFFRGLKLDILPEQDFANGHLFSVEDLSRLPADPYVVHCSWTSNLEHKMRKYHLADLWYL